MRNNVVKVICGVGLMIALGCGAALANPARLPVFIDDGKIESAAAAEALQVDGRLLLPVSFIQNEIYDNVVLDEREKQLKLRFGLPRVNFGSAKLDRLIFSKTTFALPYQTIDGKRYVDGSVAQKLLGFTTKERKAGIVISSNVYSSFAPLTLNAAGKRPDIAGQKINLAWQPTFEAETNLATNEKHDGLNVVAPSWFEITQSDGFIKNNADLGYVRKAHEKGYQVWALITNRFDPDLTRRVLASESARQNVVKQLAAYTRLYELDGINLDFENVYDSDRDALTAFVGEIAAGLKEVGATVSMDVTVPSNVSQWSSCYDRKSLGKIVDYVMVMAYDEHWRTSPVSGSVASIGWVERGVVNTLKEVPAQKVVLGVPFYMREWEENRADGSGVRAKTMTMQRAEETIREKGLRPVWLEDQGQYYFEYESGDKRYRVWQEERRSIELKLGLVDKYALAGAAAWRKGFEKPEIWSVMREKLKIGQESPPEDHAASERKDKKQDNKVKAKKESQRKGPREEVK